MTRAALLLVALLALSGPARAGCEQATTSNDLVRALNAAQSSYASLDTDGFQRASAQADAALTCLGEAISPPVAAQFHRNDAIKAYIADDLARVRSAFRAALTLQPGWRMPEDVVPPGSPLAALYTEAQGLGPGPDEPVLVPKGLVLMVDGASAQRVPSERPTILQIAAPDGRISETIYLRVGEVLPPELRGLAPPPPPPPILTDGGEEHPPPPPKKRAWLPLAVSAGASGLLAGGCYALSASSYSRYTTPGVVDYEDLPGLKRLNHAEVLGSAGLGLAALGLGLGAVIVVAW